MWNVYREALMGFALSASLALSAHAGPDNRPGDRFFFGLGLGVARGPTARFDPPELGGLPALAYETSYFANDYFGVGLDLHINWMSGEGESITNIDLGLPIVVGVPLRWVQPYAGVWLGLDRTYFDGEGTSGFRSAWHPIAGANGYISRNLRVFLQWESLTLRDCPSGSSACGETGFGQELLIGVRGSPDWFHRLRWRGKAQTLYWSVAGTVLLWGLVIWAEE